MHVSSVQKKWTEDERQDRYSIKGRWKNWRKTDAARCPKWQHLSKSLYNSKFAWGLFSLINLLLWSENHSTSAQMPLFGFAHPLDSLKNLMSSDVQYWCPQVYSTWKLSSALLERNLSYIRLINQAHAPGSFVNRLINEEVLCIRHMLHQTKEASFVIRPWAI